MWASIGSAQYQSSYSADWLPRSQFALSDLVARRAALLSDWGTGYPAELIAAGEPSGVAARRELLIVQGGVADVDRLLAQLARGGRGPTRFDVFVLDPSRDGVEQVSAILARYRRELDAVHFVTHGSSGEMQIGSTLLNHAQLRQSTAAVAAWGDALKADGDILLYGCDVAAGGLGRSFVDELRKLTGADLAASVDATGSVALGGNLALEYLLGGVETPTSFAAGDALPGLLSLMPTGTEFRLNATTAGEQKTMAAPRSVAFAPDGSFVAVWSSDLQDGNGWGIYGRRFDATGAALGGEFRINTTVTGDQIVPSIGTDKFGNFVVTWSSFQSGDWDVYARRFAADGTAQGGEFLVNGTTVQHQLDSAVAVCPDGDFLISWTGDETGDGNIYARRYDAAGAALGSAFRVNSYVSGDQLDSQVAMDALGNVIVVWTSVGQDGDKEGIYGQRIDGATGLIGGEFRVNTVTAEEQRLPSVAMNASGEFVVAWTSRNQDGSDYGVYAQRFTDKGTRVGGEFRVNTETNRMQTDPSVAIDSSGAFVVTWTSERQDPSDDWGVYGQRFDAAGLRDGGEFRAHAGTVGDQQYSAVAIGPGGRTLVLWSGQGAGDADGIFAKLFQNNAAGVIVTPTTGLVTSEGGTQDSFTVVLASQPTGDVTITISSSNPAEAVPSVTSLIFTPGTWNQPQTVVVTGVNDFVVDGNQSYTIGLTCSSSDGIYAAIDPPDVSGTNSDDDAPGVSVTAASGPTSEAGGSATFQVVLRSQPSGTVTVTLTSTAPGEGTLSTATLVFTAADWNVPQTVTVTGVDDFVDDGDKTYAVNVTASSSVDTVYNSRPTGQVWVTNHDDDTAGIRVSLASGPTTEAGGQATFTVVLNSQPTSAVTLTVNSTNSAEGTVSPAKLVFTPANWNMPRTVTVTGVDDFLVDGDVFYSVSFNASASADPGYAGVTPPAVPLVNRDDDVAGIAVSVLSGPTTEAGGAAYFKVVLTSLPVAPVTIRFSSANPDEAQLSQTQVTFTPANWNVTQVITVTGVDDWVADGDQPFRITFSPVLSTDLVYAGLTLGGIDGVNLDDDRAGIIVSPASGVTTEAGGTADFTVRLSSQPTSDVTITLLNSNAAEGSLGTRSLVFTPTDWSVPRRVTVTGVDDFVADGDVRYTVVVQPQPGGDSKYDAVIAQKVGLVNRDDDVAGYRVSPGFVITKDTGTSASWGVALTSQPTAPVVLRLTSARPDQGTLSVTQLVFDASNWSVMQTVTVTGLDDGIERGDQIYMIDSAAGTADAGYSRLIAPSVRVRNIETFAPAVVADVYDVAQGGRLVAGGRGVLANDTDADGDALTAELAKPPANGRLQFRADGSFTYVPDDGFSGSDRFYYRATDGHHVSALVVVEVTVVAPPAVNPSLGGGTIRPPVVIAPVGDMPTGGGSSAGSGDHNTAVFANVAPPTTPFNGGGGGGGGSANGELELAVAASEGPRAPIVALPAAVLPPVSAPSGVATTQPTMPGPAAIALDRRDPVYAALDRATNELRVETRRQATADAVVASGAVLSAGYALLNTRLVYWFLSALAARPAVWRRLDPIDVLYAWEKEGDDDPSSNNDSLQSLVS